MKRATISGANKPLLVSNYPVPECPEKGMLIKVLASGICHTDLHLIEDKISLGNGKFFRHRDVVGDEGYIGITPGHEVCGSVMEIGSVVQKECTFKVGDKVMVFPWRGCGNCEYCENGRSNQCESNKATCTDVGKGLDGRKHGGYQSHFPLPEWYNAVKLPDGISPEIGCMFPCSSLTTFSSIQKAKSSIEYAIKIRNKANILIIGAGGLGMWMMINLRALFKDKVQIYCADISEEKLQSAKEYGASESILFSREATNEELIAKILSYAKMDAAFDIVANPNTLKAAFHCLHNGATLVPIGLAGGEMALPAMNIIGRSINICGNRVGELNQLQTIADMYGKNGLPKLPAVVFFNIEDVNDALDQLRAGKINGRAILKFD